jgi:tripartite-type tricarboxylate transporter receptor subunit TctC
MKLRRRKFLHLAASAVTLPAALLSPCAARAQTWPSRPVTIMMPQPAGGIADLLARGTAQALSEELGQPFVVENRPGASGNLAATAVAKAAPDGGSFLFATQAQIAFNKLMFASLPYDPERDLIPVVLIGKSPVVFVASLNGPITSLQAMIDAAKAKPGQLTIGQTGVGSMSHVAYELLQLKTGIVLNGVPYKGGAPMMTDLLGGHIPLGSDLLSNFIQLAQDNKVRLLAVATTRRFDDLPDLPTVQEVIRQPFEAAAWFAIMARTGTPSDIVQKINAIANRYLQSAKAKKLIAKAWVEPAGGTPADAAAFIKLELERWRPVIKAANISLN